jgi:hypothetical protein
VMDQPLVSLPLCQPAASDVLGAIHRMFDHSRRRVARKMKDVVLTMLQSNQHLLMRALKLREAVWTRWQVTKYTFARPLQWDGPMRHQSAAPVCDPTPSCLLAAMAARGLDAIWTRHSTPRMSSMVRRSRPARRRLAKIPDASRRGFDMAGSCSETFA